MKVAQIGYGRWGRNLYRALTNISEIKQVMICDPYIDLDEDEFNLITFNEILNDYSGFIKYVFDDLNNSSSGSSESAGQNAFGVWKPGD